MEISNGVKRYINLLPPAEQQELRTLRLSGNVKDFGIWLCLTLAITAMLFVAIRFYLNGELENSQGRLATEKELLDNVENSAFREDLDRFNSELADSQTLQSKQNKFSEVLIEIAQKIPKDITLDTFALDEKTGRIEIGGKAGSRDSVLSFRRSILDSERFTNINFPLSNLEKPRDLIWHYSFYLKKSKPKNDAG